jgi:hypothetical protein
MRPSQSRRKIGPKNFVTMAIVRLAISLSLCLPGRQAVAFYMTRLSVAEFKSSPVLDEPVVVENVLPLEDCTAWTRHILTRSGHEDPLVERRGNTKCMKLEDAVALVMQESSHYDPIYVSSKGSSCSTDQLPLYDVLDSLFTEGEQDGKMRDWLPLFTLHAPFADNVVVAGQGSSSPLECRPYYRFSVGLSGNQVWRILPPDALRQPSESIQITAWDGFEFSVGYLQRNGGLFEFRHSEVAHDFGESPYMDEDKFIEFQDLVEQPDLLKPSLSVKGWYSTVLLDGDVLVIPPHWWYQSYGLEFSVSLQSQRCHDLSDLLLHIVQESSLVDIPSSLLAKTHYVAEEEASSAIDKLFSLLAALAKN